MGGIVGCGDEVEEKEDEVGYFKDAGELFMDNLFFVGYLLLCVSSEFVLFNNFL